MVSESDDLLSIDVDSVVSTKSSFPFWDAVLTRNDVFDAFVDAVVRIVEKLDLSTETVRLVSLFELSIIFDLSSLLL